MRIILISIAAVIVTFVLILTARIWGQGQRFAEFKSPFFDVAAPMLIIECDSLAKIKDVLKQKEDAVIWVDVRVSEGRVPFILPPSRDMEFLKFKEKEQYANPKSKILQGNHLSDYRWEQINEFYKNTPALKELYEQFPKTRFILNVVDNVADVQSAVVDSIKDLNPDERTLIQSEAVAILDSIKELKPIWVYGTSTPDIMRLLSFNSLFILPATQFKGDVFIAPFVISKRNAFNSDIIVEMRRRHKKILLGPITTPEQYAEAKSMNPDGFIADDLSALLKFMAK